MKTKYFVSSDKRCVWRFKDGRMTFVDTSWKSYNRLASWCEVKDFKTNQVINYRQARAIHWKCVA